MSFRVVIDSCGELTDEMKKSGNFVSAPLTLQVDEYIYRMMRNISTRQSF